MLFADDTLVYTMAKSNRECWDNIRYDVRKINEWLKMSELKLNESRTKVMEVDMISDEIFKINGNVIENVKHIKYLGFIIDKKKNYTLMNIQTIHVGKLAINLVS